MKESLELWSVCPNTLEACLDCLRKGDLLFVSPGGVAEMISSESDKYNLIWNDGLGFAQLIHVAKSVRRSVSITKQKISIKLS